MRFGKKEHTQASQTRPGLAPFTSATRHRGARTVVEPTISVALQVEVHRDRKVFGDAAALTPVGDPRPSPCRDLVRMERHEPVTFLAHPAARPAPLVPGAHPRRVLRGLARRAGPAQPSAPRPRAAHRHRPDDRVLDRAGSHRGTRDHLRRTVQLRRHRLAACMSPGSRRLTRLSPSSRADGP